MAQEWATHVCASLYKFSVVGQRELFKSFEAVAGPNVSCEALKSNSFNIRYPLGSESHSSTFIKLVKEFIVVKSDEEEDMFEEPMATRMKGTQVQSNAPVEGAMKPQTLVPTSSEGHLIDHEHITRVWVPDRIGRWLPRPARISDELLTALGNLCDCRIERPDGSNSTVIVKGDTEQNVDEVFEKLKIMDEATIQRLDFPSISSFPITEGDVSFEMRMVSLGALARDHTDRRVRTTLLSPNSKLYKSVRRALVISMIQSRGVVVPKQIRLRPAPGKNILWEDYPAQTPQVQKLPTTPVAAIDEKTNDPQTSTSDWVEEVGKTAPSSFINPFQGPKEVRLPIASEVTYKQPVQPTISKPSTKRRRVIKGALAAAEKMTTKPSIRTERDNEFMSQVPSVPVLYPHQRIPVKEQVLQGKSQPIAESKFPEYKQALEEEDQQSIQRVGLLPEQQQLAEQQVTPDIQSAGLLPEQQPSLEQPITPGIQDSGMLQQKKQKFEESLTPSSVQHGMIPPHLKFPCNMPPGKEHQVTTKGDGSENTPLGTLSRASSNNHGPPITTPFLPQSSINSPFEPHPSENEWKLVDRARMGELIDFSAPIEDKVQDPRAVSTRGRNLTMKQKAPSHQLPVGKSALLKRFDDAAAQLLDKALRCHGPIDLAVGLGRLVIDPDQGSTEFKNKSFNTSEWSSAFPTSHTVGQSALETIFTPRLTTSPIDVQSILDICQTQGKNPRKLFNFPEVVRKVSYAFVCKTKENEQITITVGEDGISQVIGSEIFIGAIDWHFAKRSFDARLSVIAHEPLLRNYEQHAQDIASSMTISMSSNQQTLLTTQPKEGELAILSITRHRETAYTTRKYADLLLNIREVQEFELFSSGNESHGVIKPSKEMIIDEKLWYEAFLTSTIAKATMRESDTLELGDMATWSPEDIISKGVIQNLHELSCEVVANIDHIGFDNKGPKGSSGTKSTTYQQSIQSDQKNIQKDQKSVQTTITTSGSYW